MDYLLIFLLVVVIAILIVILIQSLKQQRANDNKTILNEIWSKLIALESSYTAKLEAMPEKLSLQNADMLQIKFTNLAGNQSENNNKLIEKFGILQTDLTKALSDTSKKVGDELFLFKDALGKGLTQDFDKLNLIVESKLDRIDAKVQQNLSEGFEKTNETFRNIVERLAKIDEAQRKIEELSGSVVSLQSILTDKKLRGIFGEAQLNLILSSVFGERNDKIYSLQYKLSNQTIVDAMIFAPEPIGDIPIDSKFPLENYRKLSDSSLAPAVRDEAAKMFKSDLKKHIDDISSKYLISGESADSAIMFLPAESIFSEINSYHQDIVDYSYRKHVWIASPTTFMAVLTTLKMAINDIDRKKHVDLILNELKKLADEFNRYSQRWDKLARDIGTVEKDVKDIHITTQKIGTTFERIAKVEIEEQPNLPGR